MTDRRDPIEDVIQLIQERMEAHGVQRVTELPQEEKERLVEMLREALQRKV